MHDVLRELRHADLVPFFEERFELLFVVSMLHRFWIVRGQELVVPALQLSLIGMVDPVQLGVQFLFGKVRRDAVQELPPVLEGATILLQCLTRGVGAAIQLAEPTESARRVTVRGVPGERRNIAVRLSGGYFLSIASGSGRDFLFRMLRNAARLSVRVSDQELSFDVFGSDAIVSQCLQQQEGAPQN